MRSAPRFLWLSLVTMGVLSAASGCLPAARCGADTDCTDGKTCQSGVCAEPGAAAGASSGGGGASGGTGSSGQGSGASSTAGASTSSAGSGAGSSSGSGASASASGSTGASSSGGGGSGASSSGAACGSGQCSISGGCVAAGAVDPGNPCMACDAVRDPAAYSPVTDSRACDDGTTCTANSTCNAGGTCTGPSTRDADNDTHVDIQCAGGTDCNDADPGVHPGVADTVQGVNVLLSTVDPGGDRGLWIHATVDGTGTVHAVFKNTTHDDLEYMHDAWGYWATTTLDALGDAGNHARVAVATDGTVHVVHHEAGARDLVHLVLPPGAAAWERVVVSADTTNDSGRFADLLVAADGTAHVAYLDATDGDLVYRNRVNGTWSSPMVLESTNISGEGISLAQDAQGRIRVAYRSSTCGCLKEGVLRAPLNAATVDDPSADVGRSPVMLLDPGGPEHVFHLSGGMRHSWRASPADPWSSVDLAGLAPNRIGAARLADGRLWACAPFGNSTIGFGAMLVTSSSDTWANTDDHDFTLVTMGLPRLTDCSVVALPGGHALLALQGPGNGTYVARTSTGIPANELVDGVGDRGRHVSMVMDAAGALHAAYYDASNTSLRYARRPPGGTWHHEEVDNTAVVGEWPAIAVDGTGQVHIAFHDNTADGLRYTAGTTGAWAGSTLLDNVGNPGTSNAVLVDTVGNVYVVTLAATTHEIRLHYRVSGNWEVASVDTNAANTGRVALARDAAGVMHVAWRRGTTAAYRRGAPGNWDPVAFPDQAASSSGEDISLLLDAAGNPHVIHYAASTGDLRHAWNPDNGRAITPWQSEAALDAGNVGRRARAVFDGTGTLHVACVDDDNNRGLTLAQRTATGWTSTPLGIINVEGLALAVNGAGGWHAAFYESSRQALRHLTNTLPGLGPLVVAAPSTQPGAHTSIAVDASGTPHVAWQDERERSLRYARRAAGNWFHATLDKAGDTGRFAALAMGPTGNAHLAYRSEATGDLVYGLLSGGVFTRTLVDSQDNVGEYAAIAVDGTDAPVIAYHDVTNRDLKVAILAGTDWIVTPRETVGDQGRWASVALDEGGGVHVAWRDESNNDLRYVTSASGTWSTSEVAEPPPNLNSLGMHASIAVDARGVPLIAHRDNSANDLRFTTRASGSWVGSTVDATDNVGTYCALALDAPGNRYLAYRVETGADVRIALADVRDTWQVFDVDVGPDNVGEWLDLAVTPDGHAWVSYLDKSRNRVRVAQVDVVNNVDDNCDGR